MEIENWFHVDVPVEEAWRVLLDLERIAPCMPGAQLQEVEGDEYRGTVKVKVGPITAQYKGTARLEEVDEATHTAVLAATGRDTRGQGNASASIKLILMPDGDGTRVEVETDLSITGKVAQFGRGVLVDVSSKLMGQFVENVERDVLNVAGGGDTSHAGGPYEQALEHVAPPAVEPATAATTATTGPRRIDSPEVEPVDLLGVAGAPVTKRLVPIGIGALVLWILWRVLRRHP
jgi:uncharacterized protein